MKDEQIGLQMALNQKIAEIRIKNPSFSKRAFAKKISLTPGALSGILNGKRRVSYRMASRIAEKLLLDPQQRAEVLEHFPQRQKGNAGSEKSRDSYLRLNADQFFLISEWYHFAILSLLRTRDFRNDPIWIAERLGISPRETRHAIERLTRVGVLIQDNVGQLQRTSTKFRTTDDVVDVSIRKAHATDLLLAQQSLERDDVGSRDFSSIVMPIDLKKMPEAKEKIRRFQDEMAELLESGEKIEVYKFCMQLFPLTKNKKEQTV